MHYNVIRMSFVDPGTANSRPETGSTVFLRRTMNPIGKRAIILLNLGSPDSTSTKDVHKYLMEFLWTSG